MNFPPLSAVALSMRATSFALGAVSLAALLGGCGGGGSETAQGGRPPIAPEPTCTAVKPALTAAPVGGGQAGVVVPPTSVPKPNDAGVRAHTNHLILRTATSLLGGPSGLSPTQVRGAYGDTQPGSSAIAVVDAFNYPTALHDFNVFSSTFKLPTEPSSSVTSSGNAVLQVVFASGSQPPNDAGWSQESALDTEWAHAMAPKAKIYLVEAASDNMNDIMAAVQVAETLPGVKQVSLSFGTGEVPCDFVAFNDTLVQAGVTFFAAAGDSAGERDYPAESYNVVAVGGTSLSVTATGQWQSERAWSSTGCGPSHYEPRPPFQDGLYSKVGLHRADVDISAVADPHTGVSVYDSTPSAGMSGWMVFGGTSASTAIIAGCVNAAGNTDRSSQALNGRLYSHIGSGALHDIRSGSSAGLPATSGWDFPTGVGTPNGLSAIISG